jgi:tetratricopeptide (TPR) repeat protein
MPVPCARHAAQPAWWQCPRCSKTLCPLCIARNSEGSNGPQPRYLCPICGVEANDLELFRVLAPLWERLPQFLAYPFFSGSSALLVPALALATTLLAQCGFVPAATYIAVWSIAMLYALAALRSTSSGSLHPPPLTRRTWEGQLPATIQQIVLFFTVYLIFRLLIAEAHIGIAIVAMVVCALVLPAVVMLVAIDTTLFRALKPHLIIGLIGHIGRSYYPLCCFMLLSFGMAAVLGSAAGPRLPGWARIFVTAAAFNYATIVFYHMAGYVILLYHDRLDYPVDLENVLASLVRTSAAAGQSPEMQSRTAEDDLLAAINRLMRKGDFKGAIRQIEMHAKAAHIDNLDLSQRYLDLLRGDRRPGKFLTHAAHHLELLAKSGYNSKALSLYMECIRMDKNFAPQALVLFKLAGWLDETGKSREAVYVLNCLIKHHPQNTMVPKALYRVAQIFHQGMKDAERSKKILTGLIQKFPDHEITAFARNYLVSIQK